MSLDIEILGDRYEEEQEVLRELAREEELVDAIGLSECMAEMAQREAAEDCPLAQVDSCTALQIVDGLVPVPACFNTGCPEYLDCQEQRIIDNAKAAGVPL